MAGHFFVGPEARLCFQDHARFGVAAHCDLLRAPRDAEIDLHIHRDELLRDLNSAKPLVLIPEKRVKAATRSISCCPIWRSRSRRKLWALRLDVHGPPGGEPLNRKAMACAPRGNKTKRNGKVLVRSVGLCEQLGSLKVPRAIISMCVDHTVQKDKHGEVSAVTGKHYDQDPRIAEKREAL